MNFEVLIHVRGEKMMIDHPTRILMCSYSNQSTRGGDVAPPLEFHHFQAKESDKKKDEEFRIRVK